jgi:hypothetical protein
LRAKKRALGEQAPAIDYGDFHPVVAASAQIAGNQLALEGIRLLLGMPVQTAGLELSRNLLDYTHYYVQKAEPLPDCPVGCGRLLHEARDTDGEHGSTVPIALAVTAEQA